MYFVIISECTQTGDCLAIDATDKHFSCDATIGGCVESKLYMIKVIVAIEG